LYRTPQKLRAAAETGIAFLATLVAGTGSNRPFQPGTAPAREAGREAGVRQEDEGMTEIDRLEQRLCERFEALHQRMEAMERRADQRFAEIRVKQEEDIQLLKAMSCQLRGRVERVERRAGRGVT
jgi:hypothetical protein